MELRVIAEYLHVSESIVAMLAEKGVLPGTKCDSGWEVTFKELEEWYVALSGRQWAELVNAGVIVPFRAETEGTLHCTLDSIRRAMARIGGRELSIMSKEAGRFVATLKLPDTGGYPISESVPSEYTKSLNVFRRCESILSKQVMRLEVQDNAGAVACLEDDLPDLAERDREIIRYQFGVALKKIVEAIEMAC